MGVSVRVSRNVRVGLPFWVAIPVWLVMLAVWLATVIFAVVAWLIARGIAWLIEAAGRLVSRHSSRSSQQ